MTINPRREG